MEAEDTEYTWVHQLSKTWNLLNEEASRSQKSKHDEDNDIAMDLEAASGVLHPLYLLYLPHYVTLLIGCQKSRK